MFLGEDLDIYRRLIPRYFPSADKYDLKHESGEQQGDGEEEDKEVKEEGVHEKDDGEANEKPNQVEETEGLYVWVFLNSKAFTFCLDYFVCVLCGVSLLVTSPPESLVTNTLATT